MRIFKSFTSIILIGIATVGLTASSANASLITVEGQWFDANSKLLTTTAVFESGSVTDFATNFTSNAFSLTSFELVFDPAIGAGGANEVADVFAVLSPSSGVSITFNAFNDIIYGAGAVEFTPGVSGANNFSINSSLNRMALNVTNSGRFIYTVNSSNVLSTVVSPVPSPATGVLFLTGLLGLAGLRLRERNGR